MKKHKIKKPCFKKKCNNLKRFMIKTRKKMLENCNFNNQILSVCTNKSLLSYTISFYIFQNKINLVLIMFRYLLEYQTRIHIQNILHMIYG